MTVRKFILGEPLPPDVLQAIGLVGQMTGQVEYELALVIKRSRSAAGMTLEDAYELARSIFSRKALQDKARQAYEPWALDQKREGDFNSILARLDDVAEKRNRVMHDCWAYDQETRQVRRTHFGLEIPVDVDDLYAIARAMAEIIADLTRATGHPEMISAVPKTPYVAVSAMPISLASTWHITSSTAPGFEKDE
jgi:hypothetical protein